ncbi:gamma-glutamyltransferase [Luteipulveratus mongoliensis]|uniref:Gamma-glutamyltranspeptidase n=1 Tax=Luteipulveratus mongoliensis TaxID=571913 RepID=A0A0K1JLB6_9MICO|nr:gamma-glutamyltransferase [Luteipulveratus mongoliensis]AKU17506.1 gamma-glutamyltranspeptidase [Luteipulveratus mongoliensis]
MPDRSVRRTAVAAPNALAAQAGVDVVQLGGTAVDAALAAMAATFVSEPGIVSALGGAFIAIWPTDGDPVVVDGNVEMPGRGLPKERFGQGVREVWLDYAGGMTVHAGAGSVATPGAFAAMDLAHQHYGQAAWADVIAPAVHLARRGFRVGSASGSYLQQVGGGLFTFDPETRAQMIGSDGQPLGPGDDMTTERLAESLEQVAAEGAKVLYAGELGQRVADHVQAEGGLLTRADLTAYAAVIRPATVSRLGGWQIASNPPPSIGGPVLTAMLRLLGEESPSPEQILNVQRQVLTYRRDRLDTAPDLEEAGRELLEALSALRLTGLPTSQHTAHVSAVDSDGLACAITASAGYSSGVTVPGTGLLLNNCLGEPELNRRGLHALDPGTRLASNMAPTTARHGDGSTLAIGSPGADRITTALQQVLAQYAVVGRSLQEAIDHPRLHVRVLEGDQIHVEHEPDPQIEVVLARRDLPATAHEASSMYFGGVGAAHASAHGELSAAADPRRAAATAVG